MGWLRVITAEAVELAGPAPLCIENPKGQAQVGWALTGLCQTWTLKHDWKAWADVWAVFPTGALWVCGTHVWIYLPGNCTGHCTGGWPYLPARVQKTLVVRPTSWEAFKARHLVKRTSWWYYPLAILFFSSCFYSH